MDRYTQRTLFSISRLMLLVAVLAVTLGVATPSAVLAGSPGVFLDSGQALGSSSSRDVALGDLDGDGDLDAFVANDNADRVWINQGGAQSGTAGQFQNSGQALSSSISFDVDLGDVDGDGDLDAFVANNGGNTVWLNQGGAQNGVAGQFQDSGQALGNLFSYGVALGDVDGDGDLDVFVANLADPRRGAANRVWVNQGGDQVGTEGQFQDSGQALGNSWSTDVALGDVDGDGDLDAFVANSNANRVWVNQGGAQNGAAGQFRDSGQALGNSWSQGVALGDVDGDGDLDAFVANDEAADRVWMNQGGAQNGIAGQFQDSAQALGSSRSDGVALGDVDGDGDLDAFVANLDQSNRVWVNQGGAQNGIAGQFQDSSQALGSSQSDGVALGDVDGDGDLDAFVTNFSGQPNRVWLNQTDPAQGSAVTVHAHTGAAPGTGQAGWTVRIYEAGSNTEVASGVTDVQGDVTFTLDDGQYEYTIEKDVGGGVPVAGARRGFTVAGAAQTVNHRLSVLTVHVVQRGTTQRKFGYTIRIYGTPDGSGPVLTQQDLDANGETTFVLPDGGYSLTAQKGCYTSDPASGFALAYGEDLVKDAWRAGCVEVVVWVKDNADKPYQGYTVRFYDDTNRLLGTRTTNYRGWARIYLEPFARYAYSVSKSDVESARRALGSGDLCGPVDETYRLARTTIHVGDPDGGSHAAHRVRIYNGGGQIVKTLWTDANGNVSWPLIEGNYSYDVYRKRVASPRVGFVVAPPSGGVADDQTLEYTLAKVTVHVQNQWGRARAGRATGVYVYPGTRQYGSRQTDANGDAVHYVVEGQYRYRVWQTGYNSGYLPAGGFAIARGESKCFVHVVP